MNAKKQLIEILFDNTARIDEKDDAALYLAEYCDDREVIEALIKKGSDADEDDMVLETCGESLAQIWIKKGDFDELSYRKLLSNTRVGVYYVISHSKPDWIKQFELGNDSFEDNNS